MSFGIPTEDSSPASTDDFTSAGPKGSPHCFKPTVEQHHEFKEASRLGPGAGDDSEGCVLNRIIRWSDESIAYEADPRQADKLIAELGWSTTEGTTGWKSVSTPCVKPTRQRIMEDRLLLFEKVKHFRGLAGRAKRLARSPDFHHAAKEICRWMQEPIEMWVAALNRLARYLIGRPRLAFHYR